MSDIITGASLKDVAIHLTGIKGTGMAALAELLHSRGARVTGSDVSEQFYTDGILRRLGIPYVEEFSASNLPPDTRLVIHSAAYDRTKNPELLQAQRLGIPILIYPEALGLLSHLSDSTGIAGVHGKTTTTAIVGTILKSLGMPVSVLVGSAVPSFGDFQTLSLGSKYFVAETCEYRRHFLYFDPTRILLTNVEPEHLDYFCNLDDILDAFTSYVGRLHSGGVLIYCADDVGAAEVSRRIATQRSDVVLLPYGITAKGRFHVAGIQQEEGRTCFELGAEHTRKLEVRIPGRHTVLDAAGAVALCATLVEADRQRSLNDDEWNAIGEGLKGFRGSRRRSEILGEARGILVMDDYAHHPTAIRATLEGLRSFYPGRRLVVDFMSHTYSRTEALFRDFATAFSDADLVILHKIYASARERTGSVTGRDLYEETAKNRPDVYYFEEAEDALPFCLETLRPGDVFITMGAGNNWTLSHRLLQRLSEGSKPS